MSANRVALVTGGGGGIGEAVCRAMAKEGWRVAVQDRDEAAGRVLADAIDGTFISGDLTEEGICQRVIGQTVAEVGRIDALVNNAGFQHIAPLKDFPERAWEQMMALMVTAPFLLMRYAWPHMEAQEWGRVVNMASIHGLVASANKAGYVTAKHGLIGLTKTAALEGGPVGITVNAICPAYVRTPLVENQIQAQADTLGLAVEEVETAVFLKSMATKKLIDPGEVASLVTYLCSDAARSVTGASLTLDAGWTAQ